MPCDTAVDERLAALSVEMQQLKDLRADLTPPAPLQELDDRESMLRSEYNSLLNCKSPISSLPDEIFAMILEAGTDDHSFFPIHASHVARSWRRIALETPRLWNTVSSVQYRREEPCATYFDRSAPLPVSFSARIGHNAPGIAGILKKHAHRIGTLSCSAYYWSDHQDVLRSLASVNFPILKHLALISEVGDWSVGGLSLLGETCPALVSMHIECVLSRFPLRQLPSLTAVRLSCSWILLEDVIAGLRGTQVSLKHLEFNILQSEGVTWTSDMILELPALQTLAIWHAGSWSFVSQVSGLMGRLYAPALQTLALQGLFLLEEEDEEMLTLIAQMSTWPRRFPCLRALTCPTSSRDGVGIARMIAQALPEITQFSTAEREFLFALFQDSSDGGVLWPHLHTISFDAWMHESYTLAEMTQLLSFRKAVGHPIEILQVRQEHLQRHIKELGFLVRVAPFPDRKLGWPGPFPLFTHQYH
ncbi:hypothetical protein HWV62_28525 [Athelia sp. TMB]|nr:hypothetical protein HWV62_28525 [Athelia sp. TMB]